MSDSYFADHALLLNEEAVSVIVYKTLEEKPLTSMALCLHFNLSFRATYLVKPDIYCRSGVPAPVVFPRRGLFVSDG